MFVVAPGQWLCEVERFDPSLNQWSMIAPMHHSRTGVAVTALRGQSISPTIATTFRNVWEYNLAIKTLCMVLFL